MAGGECEIESKRDGSVEFDLTCFGFKLTPGTTIQVFINNTEVCSESTIDGSRLQIYKSTRNGERIPEATIGDQVRVAASGATLFTGTFRQD